MSVSESSWAMEIAGELKKDLKPTGENQSIPLVSTDQPFWANFNPGELRIFYKFRKTFILCVFRVFS